MDGFHSGFLLLVTFGLLAFVSSVRGAWVDTTAPQFVQVIKKPKTTSAEFQVQRVHGSVYESCKFGHVVQFRLKGGAESDWAHAHITELGGGQFRINELQRGHEYEVRVACKDSDKPGSSVGVFSTPTRLETPLVNPKTGNGDDKIPEAEVTEAPSSSPANFPTMVFFVLTVFTICRHAFH